MSFTLKRGLKNVYAAEITVDDDNNYTVGTPFHLMPAGEMSRTVSTDKQDFYYDDTVFATAQMEAATEITITGAALRPKDVARLTGKVVDATTGAVIDSGDMNTKYFALGGQTENVDGTKEYFWFLRGTFLTPNQNDKSKDESTDANGMELTFNAIKTVHQFEVGDDNVSCKKIQIDTETSKISDDKDWFAQVVTPANVDTICELA